ncbi:MAG: 50S ribosomal protein L5 [Thermoplasmata archaeon]|nr:MAG: 50S ribosomal protein L5 [Thermoplasmata archaeon]
MAGLKEKYQKEIIPGLCQEFNYKNRMEAPKVTKVIINMGVGEALQNPKVLDFACEDLAQISGQKPMITRAKKSVAGFKLRKGMAIGCCVTLRGSRMYDFLLRLVSVALPRIRDFKGVSDKSFDGRGNYNFGLSEQVIFPEIDYDKIDKIRGMDITIVTSAKTDEEARSLLSKFGMPFSKR